MEKNTDGLMDVLVSAGSAGVGKFLRENEGEIRSGDRPFAAYLRELLKSHGKTQQEIITKAGFSDKYGYRLLSEDKRTRQRDYIIRVCLAGEFGLDEIQSLLKLYGMSPLYPRIARDAVMISVIADGVYDIDRMNSVLEENGMAPLRESREE